MDVQNVEKSFNCGIYFIRNQNTQSHLKLMKIMPYHSIAHKIVFEITRGLPLALGFYQLLM